MSQIFRDKVGDVRWIQSKLNVTRFSGFIFGILVALFIVYHLLFHESQIRPAIVFINNDASVQRRMSIKYSFPIEERLVPEYVTKVVDKAQLPPSCLVVIRTVDGGIGNRMFLLASAYGFARLHQCHLYVGAQILIDLRSIFIVNLNNTPVHLINDESAVNRTAINGRYSTCTLYEDLLKIPLSPNLTRYEMIGYYQAFGYFVKYKEEISYLFQFNQAVTTKMVPLVEELLKVVWNIPLNMGVYNQDNVTYNYLKRLLIRPSAPLIPVTWVGIHIRRGDLLTFLKIDTNIEYLNLAMNYYRRKYINSRFLIASDDKEYAKTHLGNNADIFITPDSFQSSDDLAALGLCEHSIVTAGSYGWWSAWLAGGNVIHDRGYPVPSQNCKREHYFPPWFLFPRNSSSVPLTTPGSNTTS